VDLPVLTAAFTTVIGTMEEELKGMGLQSQQGRNKTWRGQPSYENAKLIRGMAPNDQFEAGKCKLDGYMAYHLALMSYVVVEFSLSVNVPIV